MSRLKQKTTMRLVYFITDFMQPWIMQNIADRELCGKLIGLLGSMKQEIYKAGGGL